MRWPQSLVDVIRALAYNQEYDILWHSILSLHFPPQHGFIVERFRPTDTSKQRNWVVRYNNLIILLATWEPPYPSNFSVKPSAARFLPFIDEFAGSKCLQIHAQGTAMARYETTFGGSQNYSDHVDWSQNVTTNWSYSLVDVEGQGMLEGCFDLALFGTGFGLEALVSEAEMENASNLLIKANQLLSDSEGMIAKHRVTKITDFSGEAITTDTHQPYNEGDITFRRSFPLDVILIILQNLEFEDWKAFSLGSSQCNDIVAPLLCHHFRLSWSEEESMALLQSKIRALTRRMSRTRAVRTLTISVGWKWNSGLQSDFENLLDSLTRMSSLRCEVPNAQRLSLGGELGPLARMLCDRRSRLDFHELWWDHFIFPTSPLVDFIKSQSNLKIFRTPRNPDVDWINRVVDPTPGVFAKLETLIAASARVAEILVPLCPRLKHLRLQKGGEYMPLDFPLPWTSSTLHTLEIRFRTRDVVGPQN